MIQGLEKAANVVTNGVRDLMARSSTLNPRPPAQTPLPPAPNPPKSFQEGAKQNYLRGRMQQLRAVPRAPNAGEGFVNKALNSAQDLVSGNALMGKPGYPGSRYSGEQGLQNAFGLGRE